MKISWKGNYQYYNFERKFEKKWQKIDVFAIIIIKKEIPKLTVTSKLIALVFREEKRKKPNLKSKIEKFWLHFITYRRHFKDGRHDLGMFQSFCNVSAYKAVRNIVLMSLPIFIMLKHQVSMILWINWIKNITTIIVQEKLKNIAKKLRFCYNHD